MRQLVEAKMAELRADAAERQEVRQEERQSERQDARQGQRQDQRQEARQDGRFARRQDGPRDAGRSDRPEQSGPARAQREPGNAPRPSGGRRAHQCVGA